MNFKKLLSFLLVIIMLFVSMPTGLVYTSADDGSIVLNGDFENGTEGFISDTALDSFKVIADPDNAANHVLEVGGNTKGSYWQEITVEPYTDYVWSFRARRISGSGGAEMVAVTPAESDTTLVSSITKIGNGYTNIWNGDAYFEPYGDTWATFEVSFNSGESNTVRLSHTAGSGEESRKDHIDDWSVAKLYISDKVINGDMEDGTNGYTKSDVQIFENIADPDNSSNRVLHIGGGGSYYQQIAVKPNTNYIWTFRMKDNGDTGSTRILVYPSNRQSNLINEITQSGGGYANLNDGTYSSAATYNKAWVTFTVRFNSGENDKILLWHNTWNANRDIYMDDWILTEVSKNGVIINGNFENGTQGFINTGVSTFETVSDPDDPKNKLLHIIGDGSYYYEINVAKNTDYVWTFKMRDAGDIGSTRILVHPGNSWSNLITEISQSGGGYANLNDGSYTSVATYNKAWVSFTVKFNSGEHDTVKLWHNTWSSSREIYMDDWWLKVAPESNNIQNADFESSIITSYEYDRDITVQYTNENVHNGNGAVLINTSNATDNGYFYQSVAIEKNTDYIWRFWAKFNNTNGPIGASVRIVDEECLPSKIAGDFGTVVDPSPLFIFHRIRYNDSDWHEYEIYFSSEDREAVDLALYLYAASAEIITDDWSLEKIGATEKSDTIIDVDFEHENMGCHEIAKPCWTVTDTQAHSGKYSIQFDGSKSDGPANLLYLDSRGFICDTVGIEPNTMYRFSFWYKGEGDRLDMANLTYELYGGGPNYTHKGIYINKDSDWKYAEHIFNSEDKDAYRFKLYAMILSSNKFKIFVDDIKLEKLNVGVIDTEADIDTLPSYSPDNIITDNNETTMDSGYSLVTKLNLEPYRSYKFTASYTALDANGMIGIAADTNGTPLTTNLSLFDISGTTNDTIRKGFTFVAPENGTVYLITKNTHGTIDITDLTLCAINPTPETAVNSVVLKKPVINELLNGDFENDNYNEDFVVSKTLSTSISELNANSGSKALYLFGTDGTPYGQTIYQKVAVEANTDYVWSFYFKNGSENSILSAVTTGDRKNLLPSFLRKNDSVSGAKDSFAKLRENNASQWHEVLCDNEWTKYSIIFNSGSESFVCLSLDMIDSFRNGYTDSWTLEKHSFITGDTNNDTVIDANDLTQMVQLLFGIQNYYSTDSDINIDGNTDILDFIKLKKIIAGASAFLTKIKGDTTNDGVVNAEDLTEIQRLIANQGNPYNWNADGNNDGIVDTLDFIQLKKLLEDILENDSSDFFRITSNSVTSHRIVVSLSNAGYDEAYLMQNVIKKISGVSVPIILDTETSDGPEIIIGATTRTASTEAKKTLGINEYAIKSDSNGNIVIVGTNDYALSVAVEYFLTEYFGYKKASSDLWAEKEKNIPVLLDIKKSMLDDYTLTWNDEFEGATLDTDKWCFVPHMKEQTHLMLRNDESAVKVENGNVNLIAGRIDDNNYWTNTSLSTAETMAFKYGYLEMRAKVPFGRPAFPSFWMQSNTYNADEPLCMSEVDMFEHFCSLGDDYLQTGCHKWYLDGTGDHYVGPQIGRFHFGSEELAEHWHTYSLLWTEESMSFMVDGVIYHTIDITDSGDFGSHNDGMGMFHDYHHIIFNNYLHTSDGSEEGNNNEYNAKPDDIFPINYIIDYVRLYQLPDHGDVVNLKEIG